jgi:hypothetical protein
MNRDRILSALRERILAFATSPVSRDHAEDLTQDTMAVLHEKYPLTYPCGTLGPDSHLASPEREDTVGDSFSVETKTAVLPMENGRFRCTEFSVFYGLTEILSLIRSKVSFGTTFFATNSPFTR